ncbi:methylglutaconyl-CoA hydratase [Antricoccus suffuscus]|uniref:Methylglutaconyl-CoA hydratase n=1 Tax=Antricoccus suffuscus TaxID=1629062 RepID=A0A2T0ZJY6_9ACTN|nr:enoyl-CoA hydratase/isomerase family protein [Antricoccus suffuscus]PRZ36584.1 methylglutaconyl-CoA hydratase [Antricoccus suffuscus]
MTDVGDAGAIPTREDPLERLTLVREGAVLHVWLNRPKILNALDDKTLNEIAAVFDAVADHDDVRVVVLGGAGRAFSAGADLRNPPSRPVAGTSVRQRRYVAETGHRACQAIAACGAITIARTHGHVVGGGVLLAVSCDFRVGADDTVFSLPEVELGMPLSWGGTPLLIKEIGAARAREMIMTCRPVDAAQAERFGLLHAVVAPTDLDVEVASLSARLVGMPEASLTATKQQFNRYAASARLADLTETDSDIFTGVSGRGAAPPRPDAN